MHWLVSELFCGERNWYKMHDSIMHEDLTSNSLAGGVLSALLVNLSMLRRPARQRCDGADGARDAYKFYYSVRISYEFLISDCRGDSDLGLCSSWHLAKKMPLRSGRICFQQANRRNSEPIRPLRSGIFFARCQDVHRRQACSALQIDIRNLYDIHTEK